MPLDTGQQVRLRLQDPLRFADNTYIGDGTASSFMLPHPNIQGGTGYVNVANSWSATGASFNPTGEVVFSGVIAAGDAFRTRYLWSVFADDEIGYFTAAGGGVIGATILGIQTLIVDASKRARWQSPDGSQYDDQQSIGALYRAYSALREEEQNVAIAGGALASWSMTQGDY